MPTKKPQYTAVIPPLRCDPKLVQLMRQSADLAGMDFSHYHRTVLLVALGMVKIEKVES
jgi:hypothetical protein